MTSQPGRPTIAIQTLPNISRSKNNQTMKSGQSIWEIFFLKIHTQNVVEKLFPRPFSKKSKLSIPLYQ